MFSKCDVRNAFWHVKLDEEFSILTTFSTPFGRWTRLPFGLTPASQIFWTKLEQQLDGLEGVCNIHDDILVYGEGDTLTAAVKNHDERMCRFCKGALNGDLR